MWFCACVHSYLTCARFVAANLLPITRVWRNVKWCKQVIAGGREGGRRCLSLYRPAGLPVNLSAGLTRLAAWHLLSRIYHPHRDLIGELRQHTCRMKLKTHVHNPRSCQRRTVSCLYKTFSGHSRRQWIIFAFLLSWLNATLHYV